MSNNGYRLEESIRFGWQQLWANLGILLAVFGIYIAVLIGLAVLRVIFQLPELAVGLLNGLVIGPLLALGYYKIGLKVVDGEKPQIGDLFSQGALIFKYWMALLSYIGMLAVASIPAAAVFLVCFHFSRPLAFGLGLLLLLAALVYLILRFMFFVLWMVDKSAGPIECLKASFRITRGHAAELFVLLLALFGINLLGLLCLLVGIIFTALMSLLIVSHAYRQLEKAPAA